MRKDNPLDEETREAVKEKSNLGRTECAHWEELDPAIATFFLFVLSMVAIGIIKGLAALERWMAMFGGGG